MSENPPDRLSIDPGSPFHDADALARGIGVRFKGTERTNVEEYCLSESWVRLPAGKAVNRKGQLLTVKLTGPLEVWFKNVPTEEASP